MPLPILHGQFASREDLIRFFHRTELHWARHLGEDSSLEMGTAIVNAQLGQVHDANRMMDVALPEGMGAEEAFARAEEHFKEAGSRCWKWTMAPSAQDEQTRPMVEFLRGRGFVEERCEILYLGHQPAGTIQEVGGLAIIPARASFRHVRELSEESSRVWNEPQLVEAGLLHLDDPHVDALLALKDREAAAKVMVLAVGEIGSIEHVYVAEKFRGQGIGRTMMSRALEICARSLFKHVFTTCEADNAAAMSLYAKCGFERLGRYVWYRAT